MAERHASERLRPPGRCFGVFGHPIGHSASPRMHGAVFAALGLPHSYHAFLVSPSQLAVAVAGAKALGFGGVNVTVPHKRAVIELLDDIDDSAAAIGAVNTIVFGEHGTKGYNTDGIGFIAGLAELVVDLPGSVVVLGGGGAARAVVRGLLDAHALRGSAVEIDWVSRTPHSLPAWRGVRPRAWTAVPDLWRECDLLVNATSVGMRGGPTAFPEPVAVESLPRHAAVVDLVYPTPANGLLPRARAGGLATQDGLPMLLGQGVAALELWLGEPLSELGHTAMRAALLGPTLNT